MDLDNLSKGAEMETDTLMVFAILAAFIYFLFWEN